MDDLLKKLNDYPAGASLAFLGGLILVMALAIVAGFIARSTGPSEAEYRRTLSTAASLRTELEQTNAKLTETDKARLNLAGLYDAEREDRKKAEQRTRYLEGTVRAADEFLEKALKLAARPQILIDRVFTIVHEAVALNPTAGPNGIALYVRDELGSDLTKVAARFAFGGGAEHFARLGALTRPAIAKLVDLRKEDHEELRVIATKPFKGDEVEQLWRQKVFACSGSNEHGCATTKAALAGYWGLDELSWNQEYAVKFLLRRFDEGGNALVRAIQEYASSFFTADAPAS